MASQFNLDLEKQFLSGTIRHPETRAQTAFITPADFSVTHQPILKAIDACLAGDSPFSVFMVANMLASLGSKIGGALEPGLYLKALEGLAVGERAVEGLGRELKRWTIRRKLNETGRQIVAATDKDEAKKAVELVGEITEIFNKQINVLAGGTEDEPNDLFGGVADFLATENSLSSRSILSPFLTFNDLYGSFDSGSVHVICSRMKIGKSTFWLSMLQQLAAADDDDNLRALVLDTELTTAENQSRALSAVSGVKEYFIRHKLYRKWPEMRAKVEAAEAMLAPLAGRVQHKYVGGMDLAQQLIIARRWAFKCLKEGKRGIIVLDYFKLNSSADFKNKNALFLTIGEKIDAFKNLSKELDIPILAFAQTNRENEDSKAGDRIRNSSVVGGSDMIAQFASNIYLLEKLTHEDRAQLCPDDRIKFTHRLLPIATRQLGPDTLGKNRLVRYKDARNKDRYTDNYLLLNFSNFHVEECAHPTLHDLMEAQRALGIPVAAAPENPAEDERAPTL